MLAKFNKLKKYYGDRLILDIDTFEVFEKDRIGIVGRNGAGKTTMLKVLMGIIIPEEGEISLTDSYSYISQMENYYGECEENKVMKILKAPVKYDKFLSGGEKIKLKISKALSEDNKLIIADEPTSNLDSASISVLEKMLLSYNGALILVSHDREFLDSLCNTIVEIDEGKLKVYQGNYSKYIELKQEERKREEIEYNKYVTEKKQLEEAIIDKQDMRNKMRTTPKRMGNSEARLHKMGGQKQKRKLDKNIKAMKSRIDHLEVKEKPKNINETKVNIQKSAEIISNNIIEISKLNLYVNNELLIKEASFRIRKGIKAAIIGENGCGKSTLLKEILTRNNEYIRVANSALIGYFDQDQNILEEGKSILENVSKTSSFNQSFIRINLDNFGFKGDDVFKKVSSLSGGEKVKVALSKVLLSDNNVLVLDEPTNYLDIEAMEALERALINTEKTVILVSHDRKFIENICDFIIEIKDKILKGYEGSYKNYIKEKNKPQSNNNEKDIKEKLMVLRNRLSEIISLISIEKNELIKERLDHKYKLLLKEIRILELNNSKK
ncbi:macrolide transport system ATP-binding/permease protein [Clostridium saccharoperbutylacetonicum]|uniref:ABC transporter ATP-binding protein n=2 Tax=Clostridium saccharoperbutylacetonicum TaxID=36745 RepID=M1MPZ9_9CLOT|nr:ABC-F type ribosomal protection protein CplR [Clostridium saccharoperbutylacetonicum]AGF56796.1 ABC transporter ATP-binding protein [Clostridium saccharoperbutylacetonicum N1-4(HMT)]NRT62447.1 macrolide transport system ATP-binding/permease protein [Clostridium saccharoperbutylacetonicum]NSB25789.1 macrolide transport system ATP-binding/permease protein [Clostridium saccharoperbutylacetonicum]NSB45153.1 macrolide transport system ATP-binding/permease protein [Clostridium saccharoperbutylacet